MSPKAGSLAKRTDADAARGGRARAPMISKTMMPITTPMEAGRTHAS
jgi:hypothetical protein